MPQIPENVRQDLIKLVPAAVVSNIACFVFYDYHPRANVSLDLTICTTQGELKEFYQRELVFSGLLETGNKPTDVRILRNSKCDIFYLVEAGDEIVVLSRKDSLEMLYKFNNVDRYAVEDSVCRGQPFLKIIRKDDAVPLIFDENFDNLCERAMLIDCMSSNDALPVFAQLRTKLTEAKYSVNCNETAYKNVVNLRQQTAFAIYQKSSPKNVVCVDPKEITNALKLKKGKPWVKHCYQKILIVLEIINSSER